MIVDNIIFEDGIHAQSRWTTRRPPTARMRRGAGGGAASPRTTGSLFDIQIIPLCRNQGALQFCLA